jgi:hypothetical protein
VHRRLLAFVATLTVLIGAVPFASAQGTPAQDPPREVRIIDPAGDVALTGPTGSQNAGSQYEHLDLLSIWIANETLDQIEVGARLKRGEDPMAKGLAAGDRVLEVSFDYGNAQFIVQPNPYGANFCKEGGLLQRGVHLKNGGYTAGTSCVIMKFDAAFATFRFLIPRHHLKNESGAVFGPGDVLSNLTAVAKMQTFVESFTTLFVPQASVTVSDRAPDKGVGADYASSLGQAFNNKHVALFSRDPVRVSNGESTTFVYRVDATNNASTPITLALSVENPEAAWNVRVPARLRLEAGQTLSFPVILAMGFGHRHGELAYFQVRAQDTADANAHSSLNLGVFWTDTPQPAGHHDTMYFHGGATRTYPSYGFPLGIAFCDVGRFWFNPLEKETDPAATEEPQPACGIDTRSTDTASDYATKPTAVWSAALAPSLLIGLDFDLGRTATAHVGISSPVAANKASFQADLRYFDPHAKPTNCERFECYGEWKTIASGRTELGPLSANSRVNPDVTLTLRPESDLLAYQAEANLGIVFTLTTDTPSHPPNAYLKSTAPLFHPQGSFLQLPLIEYHDPIDQTYQAVGSLGLELLSDFERPVNPAETTLFHLRLTNGGTQPQEIRVELEGLHADWAHLLNDTQLTLAPGSTKHLSLAVSAPATASSGERAELFVLAQSKDDPNIVALARLRASVVDPETLDTPDESLQIQGGSDGAPAIGLPLILLAVALLAWARRQA